MEKVKARTISIKQRGLENQKYTTAEKGTEFNKDLAGVDYTLTCDDDPEAFKLITGDDYDFTTKFRSSFNEGETQYLENNDSFDYR